MIIHTKEIKIRAEVATTGSENEKSSEDWPMHRNDINLSSVTLTDSRVRRFTAFCISGGIVGLLKQREGE